MTRPIRLPRPVAALVLAALVFSASPAALAGPTLELMEQARAAVSNDEMVVVLTSERDGPQVGPLNEAVLSQLNAALAEARRVEGVRARLGSVGTQPLYTREGKQQGWKVRGEIVLESQRVTALGQLGARLGERLQLSSVQFRLSAERRRAEEQRLLSEAAQVFRAKAQQAAVAFGFRSYEIRTLALQPGRLPGPRPVMMARSADAGMVAAAPPPPIPEEGGESEVVVAVSGTVELMP